MKKTVIFRNVNFLGLTFLCLSLLICLGFVFALPAVREITMPEGYISNDLKSRDRSSNRNYHLLLLAKNEDGYKNLMKEDLVIS